MSHLVVKVYYEDKNNETSVKMKDTIRIHVIMKNCCDKFGINQESHVLIYGDYVLDESKRVLDYGVVDGDILYIQKYKKSRHG